jgi:hypothetical protein
MNRIEIARLYAKERGDGATILSGRMGYNGMLRVFPNPDFDPGDNRSPSFIAYLEEAPPKDAAPYKGPRLAAPPARAPRAFTEGEVVE